MSRLAVVRACLFPAALAALVSACNRGKGPPPAPPPPPVTVAHPVQRDVTEYQEYTGHVEAIETVEVRARVQGFLDKVNFKEGATVKKADRLFEIDPRTFEADVQKAAADVTQREAQFREAETELARAARLRKNLTVTEEEYQQRLAARDTAAGALKQAQATLEGAKLQLSFTRIDSPIDGRISRTLVTQGNLVGAGQPTLLTTVVRTDPMYVYFDVPEYNFLEYQRLIREQGAPTASEQKVPIYVQLSNEKGFPHEGRVDFRDNRVDPGTGTIQIRGEVPNPTGVLTPGLFARVRVPVGHPVPRLLVPQVAISTDQRGQYVLVLRDDGTVGYRAAQTGSTQGELVVVEEGLKPDDWVVVNGIQRARPGQKVNAQESEVKELPAPKSPPSPTGASPTPFSPLPPATNSPPGTTK
jgi:RND family efflux transporter MFP subunit